MLLVAVTCSWLVSDSLQNIVAEKKTKIVAFRMERASPK